MEIKNLREIYFKDIKSEIKLFKFWNKWSFDVLFDMCILFKRFLLIEVFLRYFIDCWIVFCEFYVVYVRYEILRLVV